MPNTRLSAAERLRRKYVYEDGDLVAVEPKKRSDDDADIEERSLASRLRLRDVFRPLYQHAADLVVKKQVAAIREQTGRLNERADTDFLAWLQAYQRETLAPYIADVMTPIVSAYSASVERDVLDELKIPKLSELQEPFVEAYVRDLVGLYIGRSHGQIQKVLRDAVADQKDLATVLDERLTQWLNSRASRVAEVEAVRNGEAAAHDTYKRGGVTRLKWVARGKNCEYCSRLNGKVVGIDQTFLNAGEDFQPEGSAVPLKPKYPVRHAPAHRACNCAVKPAT